MQESRNFVMSYEEHPCQIDGLKGTLKTVKVKERMPNGRLKVVHSDMHFVSDDTKPGFRDLLKLFKWPGQVDGRRAA